VPKGPLLKGSALKQEAGFMQGGWGHPIKEGMRAALHLLPVLHRLMACTQSSGWKGVPLWL